MNVAVVGASGYIGETLVKLLARHPRARLRTVTSRSRAGQPVSKVIPGMRGILDELRFEHSDASALAARSDIDCVFLSVPHGTAAQYARTLVESGKKVIDISADFRTSDPERYAFFYGMAHADASLLQQAVYAMPEIAAEGWLQKPLFACPGCYPTSIILPLYPLLREGVIAGGQIVACSYSGVSGAGKKASEAFSFCEVDESSKAYGIPRHRHLSEIEEQLGRAKGSEVRIQFTPHLAPMKQGILSTIVVPAGDATLEQLYGTWQEAYQNRPFVCVLPPEERPETKFVVRSNRIDMSAVKDGRTGNFVITSAIDNLYKGAAGQMIQAMNLWKGWEETEGLLHG